MPRLGDVAPPRSAAAVAIVSTVEPVDGSAAVMPERTIEATPAARLHSSTTMALEEAELVESAATPSTTILPLVKRKGAKVGDTVGEGEVVVDCVLEGVELPVGETVIDCEPETVALTVAEVDCVAEAETVADGVASVQVSAAPEPA